MSDLAEKDRLLTSEQTRKYLLISQGTLSSLMRDGALPASKVGRQYRFRESDILRFLEAHRLGSGASA